MNPSQKGYFTINSTKKKLKDYSVHFWVWGIFIVYETIIIGILFNLFGNPLTYLLHYLVIIPLFYLHSELAMPWAFKVKSQTLLRLPLIILVQIAVYVLSHYGVDLFLIYLKVVAVKLPYELNSTFILRNVYRGFFFMGFSTGYYFLRTYLSAKRHTVELEKKELNAIIRQKNTEKELFKAQNEFLKAQINPHFLFNTLNFIYHKVSVSSPEAADAVLSLSEMMSYAISSDHSGGRIKLGDEMAQVDHLISLFKLRKNQAPFLEFNFAQNTRSLPFIPLVLLTLAENMFKHGQLHQAAHPATLSVYLAEEKLMIETVNLSRPQKTNRPHTGLQNIKNRLLYAYGEQIEFDSTTDSEDYFRLKIGVPLQQLHDHVH